MNYYEEINSEFVEAFKKKVLSAESIVVSSHKSPDDDSISSTLSVYTYLVDYLKIDPSKVKINYTNETVDKWSYFKYFDRINFVGDLLDNVSKKDLVIVVDGSGWDRFSRKTNPSFDGFSICIDHHPLPKDKFDLHIVARQYSSTAEIIYRLFYDSEKLTKEVSELLLMGILGDAGNFQFISSKNSNVLSIAEKLINVAEINVDAFIGKYQKMSKESYIVLVELMKNGKIQKIESWPDFMISSIDIKKCVKLNLTDTEIGEGAQMFTHYLKTIKGIDWGMVITPRLYDSTHSVSFRSAPGSVVTREIGEKMGIGGGHDRASGGKLLEADTKKAVKIILDWMKKNKPSFK